MRLKIERLHMTHGLLLLMSKLAWENQEIFCQIQQAKQAVPFFPVLAIWQLCSQSRSSSFAVNVAQRRRMQGWPTEVRAPWFGEAENCQSPDPSLEFTGWGVLQPTPVPFTVVSLLHSRKTLIDVIYFTSFVCILIYLVPDLSVLCLSCSYIDFWGLTALQG